MYNFIQNLKSHTGSAGRPSQPQRVRREAVCHPEDLRRLGTRDAISARGHSKRGRVKQKGSKKADLVDLGDIIFHPAWSNAGMPCAPSSGRRGVDFLPASLPASAIIHTPYPNYLV